MTARESGEGRFGAYGLHIDGMQSINHQLTAAPREWPTLTVETVVGTAPRLENDVIIGADWAGYETLDQRGHRGSIRLERAPLRARFTSPGGFSAPSMIHPSLGAVAAVANLWMGRDAFHAGAFVARSGAWAVLGVREAGKSTLLGHLASRGVGVLSDDVVVVAEDRVLAGPRCVDLRDGAAKWLGSGDDLGTVGNRRRHRVHLPPVSASVPLRGWVVPVWDDRTRFTAVSAEERLQILGTSLYVQGVDRPADRLLPLIALPFVRFGRPRSWQTMDEATDALLDQLDR